MPRATENDKLPYERDPIGVRIRELEAYDYHQRYPLLWAARFGRTGAFSLAALALTTNDQLRPLQPILIGIGLICLSLAFVLHAKQKPWKTLFYFIILFPVAMFILFSIRSAHAREAVAGDTYIGCIAAKTAISLRGLSHGAPEDRADAVTKEALAQCASLFPHRLPKDEQESISDEAAELMRKITNEEVTEEEEHDK